jgi:ureidoacrylate peracid hydrolase
MSGLDDLDINGSALLVIDMQNAFCHPQGTLGKSGLDTERLGAIIPAVRALIQDCHDAGMPVVWTLQEHLKNDRRRARKRLPAHTTKRSGISALAGSWDAQIIDELRDLVIDPGMVVRKHRFGGFYETRLHILLEQMGVRALFITGLTANACVETTIREAYLRDYDVVAVEDCISGVRPEWEVAAREVWRQYFAVTCTRAEVSGWLQRQRQPHAVGIHHLLLMVSDLERSKDFYFNLLGFRERVGAKPLPDGRPFVATMQGLGLTEGGPGDRGQVDHFAFAISDVRAMNDRLKAAGVEFERELGEGPYGLAIYIRDPDGNVLELFEVE